MKATELTQLLTELDHQALIKLYKMRCLSPSQLHEYCYFSKYQTLSEFNEKVISKLIDLGVIELKLYQNHKSGILLTTKGVDVVRELLSLPTNIITTDKKIVKRGYYRAFDLRVLPNFMNHHIHLNEFVLRFEERFKTDFPNLPYHYYDEKHLGTYELIRPDGLLQLLDIDIFLEMDMNKESKTQLELKWKKYRKYLTSKQYQYNEKRIIIFFICEGTTNIEDRKQLVMKTAFDFIGDLFCQELDMYIGSIEELIDLSFNKLINKWLFNIPEKKQLKYFLERKLDVKVYKPTKINQLLKRNGYEFFIKHNNQNQEIEFLFDDWRSRNLSILNTISLHHQGNTLITINYSRPLKYLILVNNENEILNILELFDLIKEPGVCFTTLERLNTLPLNKAIFVFNDRKQRFHFKDLAFKQLVFEKDYLDKND